MSTYLQRQAQLRQQPGVWLVTGVAGFIGSHLLQTLLELEQTVVGLDNLATGLKSNLQLVQQQVSATQWERFRFIKGDIRAPGDCHRACDGVDHVVHLAALGSVKRSLADPITTNNTNVCGFVNMLVAAQEASVSSFTYATCSSVYGQPTTDATSEEPISGPLSPYAASKQINELYADVFARSLGMPSIGLRFFNVYGPRQHPDNAHAYPVAQWMHAIEHQQIVHLNGNAQLLCDLTHVRDAVQAIVLAATAGSGLGHQVFNVASGQSVHLMALLKHLQHSIRPSVHDRQHQPSLVGSALSVCADISKTEQELGYHATVSLAEGLAETLAWFRTTEPPSHHSPGTRHALHPANHRAGHATHPQRSAR